MATAAFVVQSAAEEIGASSIVNPLAPESSNASFKRLLQMLNRWIAKDIVLSDTFVLPVVLADEMNNDASTDQAIIDNLALQIAPLLRKVVTPDLKVNAKDSYDDLLISHVARPEQPYPSVLTVGAGRKSWPHSRRYYEEPTRKDTQTVQPDPQ